LKRKTIWRNWRKLRKQSITSMPEISEPDHLNKESFPSYKRSSKEDLVAILMTGSTANLFYATAKEMVKDFADILKKFEDTKFLAKATIYARNKGFIRVMPIMALVEISRRDPRLFSKIVDRVICNPKDWQTFIDIARSKIIRDGVGRAIKREIKKSIGSMDTYHAIKYPSAVEDMINIARPREDINDVVILDKKLEQLWKKRCLQ